MAGDYNLGTATLRFFGDRSSLDREIELLRRYTEKLERQGISVKFDADTGEATRKVDELKNKLNGFQGILGSINEGLRGNGDVFENLAARLGGAGEAAAGAGGAVGAMGGRLAALGAGALRAIPYLGQIGLAVTGLTAIFNGAAAAIQGMLAPLERLAAEAGRFNKQVAEAGIFTANAFSILGPDGEVIEGTANQMRAVRGVISREYKEIQKEVSKISGATASEIYEGFNIILQNAGNLGKEGQDLGKIRNLSTRIAAGMNTLGVPGYQLRSEVNALMMGNIGPDSMLAKKLGYTSSADIQQLQAQGKFYDDLITKLNKLYEGQKVLAQSLSNVKSNFQDVAETIQSEGGQALERGLAGMLQSVLTPLDRLQDSFMMFIRGTNEALEPLLKMLGQLGGMLVSVGSFFSSLLAIVMDLAAVVTNLVGLSLGPVLEGIGKILQIIAKAVELLAKGIGGILRPLSGILRVMTDLAKDSAVMNFLDSILKTLSNWGDAIDENNKKMADGGRAMARQLAEQKELQRILDSRGGGRTPLTEDERRQVRQAGDAAVSSYNQTVGENEEVDLVSLQLSDRTRRTLEERAKELGTSQSERNLALAREAAKIKEDTYKNEIRALEQGLKLMQAQRGLVQEQANARDMIRRLEEQRVGFAVQLATSPETKLDAQQKQAEVQSRNEMARIDDQAKLLATEKDIQRTQLQIQLRQQRIQQEQLKIQRLEIENQKQSAWNAQQEVREKMRTAKGTDLKALQRQYDEAKRLYKVRADQLALISKTVSLSYEEEKLLKDTSSLEQRALDTKAASLDTQRQMTLEQLQQKTILNEYERQQLKLAQQVQAREKALQAEKQVLDELQASEQRRLQAAERQNKVMESRLELARAEAKAQETRAQNMLKLAEAQENARENPTSVSAVIGAEIEALAQGQQGYVSILDATRAESAAKERAMRLEHEAQRMALEIQHQREMSELKIAAVRLKVVEAEAALLQAKLNYETGTQKINQDRDRRAAAVGGLAPPPRALPPAATGVIGNMLPRTRGGPNWNDGLGAGRGHQGQDLGLDPGDPIHARRSGRVVQYIPSFTRPGNRYMGAGLRVRYDDGSEGTYGHLQNPAVRVGDPVSAGQRLATVYNDGSNTHLHYELRDQFGKLLNPLNAIKESLRQPSGVRALQPAAGRAADSGPGAAVNSATLATQDAANATSNYNNKLKELKETQDAIAKTEEASGEILQNQIKALQERQALELRQLQIDNKRNELTAEFMKQPWNKLMGEYTETFVSGMSGMVREAVAKARKEGGVDLGQLMTDMLERMADRYIESTLNFLLAPAEQAMTKALFGGLTGFNKQKIDKQAEDAVGGMPGVAPGAGINTPEQAAGNTMVTAGNTMLEAANRMLQAATGSPTAPGTGANPLLGLAAGSPEWMSAASTLAYEGKIDFSNTAIGGLAGAGSWNLDTSNFAAASGMSFTDAAELNFDMSGLTQDMNMFGESAFNLQEKMGQVPEQTEKANASFGSLLGGIGGLAMGVMGIVGGVQQMGKGGTYNTLMGIAGIFGGLGSITGMFGTGGMFAGKKAAGGPVDYGRTYMVGEKGPELFVPGQSGTIIANDKIRKAMGAGEGDPFTQNRYAIESSKQNSQARSGAFTSALNVKYESQVINSVEYVTADQFKKGMAESAERGRALAFQTMQNSVSARKRLGL